MSDEKLEQAVISILRMTHEGALEWNQTAAPEMWLRGTDSVYPLYFEAWLHGRKLGLFSSRDRVGSPSPRQRQLAEILETPVQENGWVERFHLVLLSDNDEVLFEFPSSRIVRDLYVAARYKAANVDEFLDELIKSALAEAKE